MHAIFLDRDGVICENRPDYVKNWTEFQFLPEAKKALAVLSQLGLPIVVVTNQAGIGRRIMPTSVVEEIHQRMLTEVTASGGRIDRILYCPHHPEDDCDCRKPKPGLLRQCAHEMGLDLTRSYMIGDAVSDLMAGQTVGCQTFLVLTGRGLHQLLPALRSSPHHFTIARNLMSAAMQILKNELSFTPSAKQLPSVAVSF